MVKELLLGDNPFIGVSHLSNEKAREEQSEATVENKVRVIEAAVKGGATGFTFSTHSSNLELLTYLKENRSELFERLNYYVLVPYAAKYVREATSLGTSQLVKKVFLGNLNYRNILYLLWPTPANLIKMFLEAELKEYMRVLPNTRAVLLHEVLTELIVAFNLGQIVEELAKHFSRKGLGFGLETRNVKHVKYFLENNEIATDYLMTPLNPLGYQMTLKNEEAENILRDLSARGVNIIAINTLASGSVTPDHAINYLKRFKKCLFAVAVGTSKSWRAYELFQQLSILKFT
ncbi:MAG: hypothetical protein QXF61_02330 [Nitrososphaeria archaeon]